jgi:accessory gene regulator protein AgrB
VTFIKTQCFGAHIHACLPIVVASIIVVVVRPFLLSSHIFLLVNLLGGFSLFVLPTQPTLETLYLNFTFDLVMYGLLDERPIFKIV